MKFFPHKARPIPIARQALALETTFREIGSVIKMGASDLTWQGVVRPSPWSREYLLEVYYHLHNRPQVFSKKPVLSELTSKKIPHMHDRERGELCAHYPGAGEWKPSMFLANSIVPWACEWFFHFECWLATSVWNGGGIEH